MHTRRLTRFRAARSTGRTPSWWQRLQMRSGAVLLTLAITAIALILVCVPLVWMFAQVADISDSISTIFSHDITRVEEHWIALPRIPALQQGDEPRVRKMLTEQPLLVALMDRNQPGRLWLRQGDRLVLKGQEPERTRYLQWIAQAAGSGRSQWTPSLAENTNPNLGPAIVLLGERWIIVKHWRLGSPQVEQALHLVLGPAPRFRAGLRRTGQEDDTRQEWGAEPNLQVDPARLSTLWFAYQGTSPALEGWDVVAIPFDQETRALEKQALRHVWMVFLATAGVVACLGLGLWLRRRARLRSVLDADRLASLTHSLKTPLAILKFRCDSIRLGRLDPDQTDAELIKVSEEVDQLTLVIENGLESIRGVAETGPLGEVSTAWISEIAQDLEPAFQAEGRSFRLELTSDSGQAARPSLRAALLTLLENALYHGKGEVLLQTVRVRRRLQIRVQDSGLGMEPHQLEALGKPFLRLRIQGKEGFEQEGQGLGLSLLLQVARKEGWGLSFASAPGEGLLATLEIKALECP